MIDKQRRQFGVYRQLTVSEKGQFDAALRSLEDDLGFCRFTRNWLDDLMDQVGVDKFNPRKNACDLWYQYDQRTEVEKTRRGGRTCSGPARSNTKKSS
jgi:hypothetical protein